MTHSPIPWQPTADIEMLKARARIVGKVRRFFDDRGFFEVHTPCLSSETVVDAHLDPMVSTSGNGQTLYLQTSPEAAMKRLMASGAEAIYQIGPVFRSDEAGPLHNPEFTMLEWYRRGDSMEQGIDLLDELVVTVTGFGPARRTTYRQAFLDQLGLDPLDAPIESLRAAVEREGTGYQVRPGDSRDDLLDVLMGLVVQPRSQGVVIVTNYPATQSALARISDEDPRTAERFELFLDGVELANGYAELIDDGQLRQRCLENNALRRNRGMTELPMPERLLAAMQQGLPRCSGTALGLDRLVMAATGAETVAEVIPFPIDRA